MPRKQLEFAGGTWYEVDLVANDEALTANTAADAVQDTERDLMGQAMSGDLLFVADPETATTSAAAINAAIAAADDDKFTQVVTFTLENAAGDVHTWYSGTRTIGITDNSAGTASIEDTATATTLKFVNGVGTVTVAYEGTWTAAEVVTLTLTDGDVMNIAPGDATFVDTIAA